MNKKFAVFDIDGTLIRWQLYHAVVDKLASSGVLGDQAKDDLRSARMVWKNREHPNAFKEYEIALIQIYEASISEINSEHFDKLVDEVIEEFKDQVYTYTRNLASELKAKGYFLLAISGSHHELVGKLAKYYGFDDWAGTQYERSGTSFSGKKFVPSLDKQKVLKSMIAEHQLSADNSIGVGDTSSDISMLELVETPIAFNPERALFEHAKSRGWQIVVERKNVVYNLTKNATEYRLNKTE